MEGGSSPDSVTRHLRGSVCSIAQYSCHHRLLAGVCRSTIDFSRLSSSTFHSCSSPFSRYNRTAPTMASLASLW